VERIRELRQARGWTQGTLAFYSGMSISAISLIESGKRNPSAKSLLTIADALGVSLGELFGEEAQKDGAPSLEPQDRLPAGSYERRRYNAPAWIALLNEAAKACERAASSTRGQDHDLDALADLEIVSFELWGTYRMTVREAVISWATEVGLSEQLAAAEGRMRDARRAISKALRESMLRAKASPADAAKVGSIEERMRRSREVTGMTTIG
jgi:transcriptional regulator with XRE-family HTH domain